MSLPVVDAVLLSGGAVFVFVGAVLAIIGAKAASAGRIMQADADARLAATQELAADVKRLVEKVEASMQERDAAVERAYANHNDACAASMHAALSDKGGARFSGGHHDDDDDDHHKKHHKASMSDHHDDDDDHKKHHQGSLNHDDDDDHKKHHAANDQRPSFLARLFGRAS